VRWTPVISPSLDGVFFELLPGEGIGFREPEYVSNGLHRIVSDGLEVGHWTVNARDENDLTGLDVLDPSIQSNASFVGENSA